MISIEHDYFKESDIDSIKKDALEDLLSSIAESLKEPIDEDLLFDMVRHGMLTAGFRAYFEDHLYACKYMRKLGLFDE